MSNIPTPHIAAKAGDFAETVLMPGDPLRAKFMKRTTPFGLIIFRDIIKCA